MNKWNMRHIDAKQLASYIYNSLTNGFTPLKFSTVWAASS